MVILLEFIIELLEFMLSLPLLNFDLHVVPKSISGASSSAGKSKRNGFLHLEQFGIGFANDLVDFGEEGFTDDVVASLIIDGCINKDS